MQRCESCVHNFAPKIICLHSKQWQNITKERVLGIHSDVGSRLVLKKDYWFGNWNYNKNSRLLRRTLTLLDESPHVKMMSHIFKAKMSVTDHLSSWQTFFRFTIKYFFCTIMEPLFNPRNGIREKAWLSQRGLGSLKESKQWYSDAK